MSSRLNGITCSIVIDSRVTAAGLNKVYFRIRQNKIKKDIAIGIKWPVECFDRKHEMLMPRYEDDPEVFPNNLKINEYKAVAHRLQLSGYLKDTSITIEDVVKEFKMVGKGNDFFEFMRMKAEEAYNTNLIRYETWNRHKSSLNTLKLFYKKDALPINKINLDFIERFDAWAKRVHKRGHNTVCGYHKDVKKYLSIAIRVSLIAKNPYEEFSFAYVDGDRQALNQDEVGRLLSLYKQAELPKNEREICCRFLFSCFTGLRISDTARIHRKMIVEKVLTFTPYKTRGTGKILKVPLSKIALDLIAGRTGLLFETFSDQYVNETLKIIAARAGIYKRLTYHCARDTFGTIFIEMTGNLKLLCDIMGHSSIKTTEIYTKLSDKYKRTEMEKFDSLFSL